MFNYTFMATHFVSLVNFVFASDPRAERHKKKERAVLLRIVNGFQSGANKNIVGQ